MFSKQFQYLFLSSVVLFIVHGLEEYFTGFYNVDRSFRFLFQSVESMGSFQASFLIFQIMLWVLLILSYLLVFKKSLLLPLLTIPALVFIWETHHLFMVLLSWSYYSGSITATLFPILGFFYRRELIRLYKTKTQ